VLSCVESRDILFPDLSAVPLDTASLVGDGPPEVRPITVCTEVYAHITFLNAAWNFCISSAVPTVTRT
jgi:hypothetical protein